MRGQSRWGPQRGLPTPALWPSFQKGKPWNWCLPQAPPELEVRYPRCGCQCLKPLLLTPEGVRRDSDGQ